MNGNRTRLDLTGNLSKHWVAALRSQGSITLGHILIYYLLVYKKCPFGSSKEGIWPYFSNLGATPPCIWSSMHFSQFQAQKQVEHTAEWELYCLKPVHFCLTMFCQNFLLFFMHAFSVECILYTVLSLQLN